MNAHKNGNSNDATASLINNNSLLAACLGSNSNYLFGSQGVFASLPTPPGGGGGCTSQQAPNSRSPSLQDPNNEKDRPFKCEQCGRGFLQKPTLRQHYLVHMPERPFTCKHCGESFKRKGVLDRHTKRKHSNVEILIPDGILPPSSGSSLSPSRGNLLPQLPPSA